MKLLFVCLGNICRSPTAEAVYRHKLAAANLNIHVDSAGTAGYHIGEKSDHRSIAHAEKRGYKMTHKARQFSKKDFIEFDFIFAMDRSNLKNILALADNDKHSSKVFLITDFLDSMQANEIPDPYYEGPEKFELVIDLLEDTFARVKNELLKK